MSLALYLRVGIGSVCPSHLPILWVLCPGHYLRGGHGTSEIVLALLTPPRLPLFAKVYSTLTSNVVGKTERGEWSEEGLKERRAERGGGLFHF